MITCDAGEVVDHLGETAGAKPDLRARRAAARCGPAPRGTAPPRPTKLIEPWRQSKDPYTATRSRYGGLRNL